MAEEITDGEFKAEMLDFKTEVMRFVEIANQKFDGLTADIRTNSFKLDRVETGLENVKAELKDLSSEVKTVSGQFRDVGVMAIKDNQRITNVEKRIDDLETGVH
jgi:peptidoglycan hydrolase CwlO-like protein